MCLNKLKLDLYKLITVYSNSIVSFDDISIDQFFGLFFFTQHVITCISSRVPLYCIMIDQNTLSKCPVRCTPVASLVNKFAEIAFPVPNYVCPVDK